MAQTRDLARDKLSKVLDGELVLCVERELFNRALEIAEEKKVPLYWESPDFRMVYKEKLRSILFNLSNPKNPGLISSVRSGDTTPERLMHMTPQEMDPSLWKPYYDRIAAKELMKSGDEVPEGILQVRLGLGSAALSWLGPSSHTRRMPCYSPLAPLATVLLDCTPMYTRDSAAPR